MKTRILLVGVMVFLVLSMLSVIGEPTEAGYQAPDFDEVELEMPELAGTPVFVGTPIQPSMVGTPTKTPTVTKTPRNTSTPRATSTPRNTSTPRPTSTKYPTSSKKWTCQLAEPFDGTTWLCHYTPPQTIK